MKFVHIPYTDPFQMSETVITQHQWRNVMQTTPWSGEQYVMESGRILPTRNTESGLWLDDYPAVYVSWDDAVEFCKKLSAMKGRVYRLPTEDEWEFACRGGTKTEFSFGDDEAEMGKYAWFHENTVYINECYAHRVAQKLPNPFGLYDMHGNVWEWCDNNCSTYKILRGGSYFIGAPYARSHSSYDDLWCHVCHDVGFRIVADL